MKAGDLVKTKNNSIGIVIEVFGELDKENPWIRVMFTHPVETYQWIKLSALTLIKKKGDA